MGKSSLTDKLGKIISAYRQGNLLLLLENQCKLIRERLWFQAPRFLHVIDYWIAKIRIGYNLYFPWTKNRGLRYYKPELTWIDPDDVNYYDTERLFSSMYFVQNGDWDFKKAPLDDKLQMKIVKELFVNGVEITQMEAFPSLIEKKLGGSSTHSYEEAKNQVIEDYQKLQKIFDDIQKNRYKTQEELGESPKNRFNTWYNEIRVSIGRNGEYILSGSGNHRLAIAKTLKLKSVPVLVIRKHYLYEKRGKS